MAKKRCGTTVMVNNDGYQRDMKRKQQKTTLSTNRNKQKKSTYQQIEK